MAIEYRTNNANELLLFFNGWAADANMIPTPHQMDICIISEWHTQPILNLEKWQNYEKITLVGWSFGVAEAHIFLQEHNLNNIHKTIAINGTPLFVDNTFGIPRSIFKRTLQQLSPESIEKFMQRMWASAKEYALTPELHSQRSFESMQKELLYFESKITQTTKPITWDTAIIGNKDLIFPPKNLQNYWNDYANKIIEYPQLPHYPFTPNFSWSHFL